MRAEDRLAKTVRTTCRTTSFVGLVLMGLLCGSAAAQMRQNNAVRGCSNAVVWDPISKPDAASCYAHCSQNGANACEWKQNGPCFVIFGTGCFLEGGYPGWWAGLLAGPSSTPVGWLDSADAGNDGRIKGWALDAAVPSTSIDVHIYVDAGTPQVRVYAAPTTVSRPDVNAAYRVSGNHGYDFAIPSVLLDGLQHRVDVYAIDPHGAGNPLLSGAPKYFTHVPQAPALVSPAGNTYQATPVVAWNATAAATEYQVQMAALDGTVVYRAFVAASSVCSGSACTLATRKGLTEGSYRWSVQARNSQGAGTWSGALGFNVLVPPGPSLVSPRGDLSVTTPTFAWTASTGATRYWLAVWEEAGSIAYQGPFETSACAGSSCTAAPGKALTAGAYTWNVQAQSPAGVKWGTAAAFSLVTPPPPALVAPSGSAVPTPTFQWKAVAGATSYKLAVDNADGAGVINTAVAASACVSGTCSFAPGTLLYIGSSYTWVVRSINAVGGGPWSARWDFTVAGPPTLVSPSGAITTPDPTYTWKPVAGATQYFLALDEMGEEDWARATQVLVDAAAVCSSSTCATTARNLIQGQYRWSVAAKSGPGGASSDWMSFSTTTPPPPALFAPNGSARPKPTFQWKAVEGATSYKLAVDTADGDGVVNVAVAESACVNGTCSFAPGTLLCIGTSYTWMVRSINAVGGGPWSTRSSFTVAGPPSLLEPGGAIASPNPLYRWKPVEEATQYFLAVDRLEDEQWSRIDQALVDAAAVCADASCATTARTLGPGQYRWSLQAKSGPGGAWSDWKSFALGWTGANRCRGAFLAADFNADGRTDQLCSQEGMTNVALSTGTGFASPTVWLAQALSGPILADYNGDGATDVAMYDGATKVFKVAVSTGTAFAPFAAWGTASAGWTDGQTYTCGGTGSARSGSGNFDGNGYADVYCRGGGGSMIFVGKSTGSSFTFSVFADYSCWGVYERAGPADFDGDGRDDWYCIDGYGGLYGRLSNGHAFEDMTFQGPGRGICEGDDWTLVDINADGRTDATCRPNGALLLSTGTGMLDTGSGGGFCNSWETVPDPEDPDDPEKATEVLRSQMRPMDTDGDRIPELVCTFDGRYFRDVTVRKWDGEKLSRPQVLETQWCRTSVQGGDFDGDGKFELVCESGAVLSAGAANVVPDLMIEAANGLGGKTTAGYSPSTVFGCNKPPVRQVVTSSTSSDGRGGVATKSYTYCDGRTDPAEGTFLGYGQVQTTLPRLEGEPAGPTTTTLYSQELRSLGRPTLVRRADGAGKVLQEVQTSFHPQSGPTLPRQALVKEVRTTDFAPSAGETKTTSVTYSYDSYANVTQQLSHGEVTREGAEIPDDELWTDTSYWPADTDRFLVSLPRLREVREQRGSGPVLLKSVESGYSAAGDLTSVSTAVLPGDGHLVRTMGYDDAGHLEHVKTELGAETTISYTADGLHPETVTGAEGSVTTLWHPLCDAPRQVTDLNGVVSTTTYDELCRSLRTEGALGAFSERFYENLGDPKAQHVRVETPGSDGRDYVEEYFDGLGRTYRSLRRGPSAGRDILTERSYNARGGLVSATAPFYEGESPDVTTYSYDPFDRLTTVRSPDGTATEKSYDLWGETTTDPRGKPTTTRRGTHSSVETTTIEGERVTTTTSFDMLGRRVSLVDTVGNTWTWKYDSLDRLLLQEDPDSGPKTIEYDDDSRRQKETDAEGHELTVEYDTLGRVQTKTSSLGASVFRYSEPRGNYKNAGRLTGVDSPGSAGAPITLDIDYDAAGRVVRQGRSIPELGYSEALQKEYDSTGRMTGLRYPDGDTIGRVEGAGGPFTYDGAGRLTTIPGILDGLTYDAAGRPLEQRNANGTVTVRTYVPRRGLLDTVTTTHPVTGLIQSLRHGYEDDLPLVRTVASPFAGESWEYDYDTGYRLKMARNFMDQEGSEQRFVYDALGRIVFNSRLGHYEYPNVGQPRPHAPTSVGGAPYEYSDNGNLVTGAGRAPEWDAENRVKAIGTTRFAYDTFGERLMKASPEGTSLYPFGDDYEITDGVVTKYISVEGLGVIAKRVTGGPQPGTYWLHTDRLGSIQAVTSDGSDPNRPAGTVVFRKTYRPYGETLYEAGEHTESRGWIDQRNDPESGLTYLHARYFDPKLGTFLSPDPIGVAGGMNLYGYALGNPVNGTDRSGLLLDAGCWLWERVMDYLTERVSYHCVASSGGVGGTNSGGGSTGSNGDGGRGVCTGKCKDEEKPKEEVPPVVTPPKTSPPPKKSNPISDLFKNGACAAARLFFAPIPFPDVLPGSGDIGLSLSVSVSASESIANQGASLTRVWMPGGDYATYLSSSAGVTVGAQAVSPATAVGSVEVGVVRMPDFGEFAGGGWQGGAAAAAGPGAAANLAISDGNAWGLSFGVAAGLTAGVAGEKTETLLLETGNVLRDMGCQ